MMKFVELHRAKLPDWQIPRDGQVSIPMVHDPRGGYCTLPGDEVVLRELAMDQEQSARLENRPRPRQSKFLSTPSQGFPARTKMDCNVLPSLASRYDFLA
jgi:hypothetical protein